MSVLPYQTSPLPTKTIITTFSHCAPGALVPRPGGGSHRTCGDVLHTDKYAISLFPDTTHAQILMQLKRMVESKWQITMKSRRWFCGIYVTMKEVGVVSADEERSWRNCRRALLEGAAEGMEFKFFELPKGEKNGTDGCCVVQ